jgi:hypothetical protein
MGEKKRKLIDKKARPAIAFAIAGRWMEQARAVLRVPGAL